MKITKIAKGNYEVMIKDVTVLVYNMRGYWDASVVTYGKSELWMEIDDLLRRGYKTKKEAIEHLLYISNLVWCRDAHHFGDKVIKMIADLPLEVTNKLNGGSKRL